MVIGLLFAILATLCGAAVSFALRAPLSLAPVGGMAAMAVLATWCARLGMPGWVSTGMIVALALAGLILTATSARSTHSIDRVTLAILAAAVAAPTVLLGTVLAGVDAPVSTHDGAFHVETIDNLRRGVLADGWYPIGFHASVAAVLRLLPWLDTARATADAAQALAILAPVAIFGLGLAIGLNPRLASIAALVQGLTYIYPYDDQLWGGWPLAMCIVLLLGLWAVAARWVLEPQPGLAALGGLIAGAIVLTHGTEVYGAVVGLTVIAAVNFRRIPTRQLAQHLPLAGGLAIVSVVPYLTALSGWAAAGGAAAVGAGVLDGTVQGQGTTASGDWLEFILGMTGAAGLIDLTLRAALLYIGARQRTLRLALVGWLVFGALLFAVSFLDVPPIRAVYVVTFPWLVRHRPPQMVVLFASLLVGGGVFETARWFWRLRPRLVTRPLAWRRLAILSGAVLFFFAEGSAVSIFKTLQQVVADQNVYSADDRAAMGWLSSHATPGEMVINDAAADAGIWTPYKAGLPILLPRTASGAVQADRGPILAHVSDLAGVATSVCALHADYVYQGARSVPDDQPLLPDRLVLEHATGLREVFTSGEAAIYRVEVPCG